MKSFSKCSVKCIWHYSKNNSKIYYLACFVSRNKGFGFFYFFSTDNMCRAVRNKVLWIIIIIVIIHENRLLRHIPLLIFPICQLTLCTSTLYFSTSISQLFHQPLSFTPCLSLKLFLKFYNLHKIHRRKGSYLVMYFPPLL